MAWNEPGSGGNGTGGKEPNDPWGRPSGVRPPGGGKPGGPPDLEQALTDLKNKFGALFGVKPRQRSGGSGGSSGTEGEGSGFGVLIAIVIGLMVLWTAITRDLAVTGNGMMLLGLAVSILVGGWIWRADL